MKTKTLPEISSQKVSHISNPASVGAVWRSDVHGTVISAEGVADAKHEIEGWDGTMQFQLFLDRVLLDECELGAVYRAPMELRLNTHVF